MDARQVERIAGSKLAGLTLGQLAELWIETDRAMSENARVQHNAEPGERDGGKRHTEIAAVRGWIMSAMDAHTGSEEATLDYLDKLDGPFTVVGTWDIEEPACTRFEFIDAKRAAYDILYPDNGDVPARRVHIINASGRIVYRETREQEPPTNCNPDTCPDCTMDAATEASEPITRCAGCTL